MIRWFRLTHLLDAATAADRLAWENSWFSIDASVRIAVNGIQLHVYCQHLEHLLRYCARPPFALERLSVIRDAFLPHRPRPLRAPPTLGHHVGRQLGRPVPLAIGNVGKRQEAATGGHTDDGRATGGCCDAH